LGIYNQGQRALPHGTFPGVGIGGHYTHGGFGYSSRRWGMYLAFVDPSPPSRSLFWAHTANQRRLHLTS
jgi:hypothetical protein